jgi:hypothetical protein
MASTVINLNTLPAHESSSIGAALAEVAIAFQHLASALVRKVLSPATVESKTLTAFEEAEALRTYAADIQAQDPNFAQDLFCAADRHEIEAAAAGR